MGGVALSFAENCREGCNMKTGVSQVQNLEKLNHNPGEKQLISILNQNYTGRKSVIAHISNKRQSLKKKKKHSLKREKNNSKWKRTHVKEVFPRTALCTAARGRPCLLGNTLGIDVGGGFSRRSHMWFPFRHAVDVQGSCNKKIELLSLLIIMLFMLSHPMFHREVPSVHS